MSRFSKIILWLNALFLFLLAVLMFFALPNLRSLMATTLFLEGVFIIPIPVLAFITSIRLLIKNNGFAPKANLQDKVLIMLPILCIGTIVIFALGLNLTR